MSDDIKVLALRVIAKQREDELGKLFNDAADALEALVADRDRLKAALEEVADTLNRGPDSSQNWDVKSIYDIARKALGAKYE